MPRYGIKKSNAACIEITDFQSTYLPGDIVFGHVVAANEGICARPQCGLDLDELATIWPRENQDLTIPESSNPGFDERGDSWDKDRDDKTEHMPENRGFRPKQTFLSNTQDDVTKHALPSVFYFRDISAWPGTTFEAFIEYVLEATLICPGAKNVTTTFPLFIRAKPTEKPLEENEYQFYVKDDSRAIYSDRLLPENSERQMTFREKSRRFFSPSKTPGYTFTVKVIYPQARQL
ncbi:hypothetical protein SUNI508_02407 [Seiridium unicorne]|uniref:Uncharacterized protein n=1 Tax=Seiridium unicorne TaxID=138068 RepID=A0ABR2UI46_9PEZI